MTNVATDVLDREFLEIRSRLLDLAASLDRLDRASGSLTDDPRLAKILAALVVLSGAEASRAEHIQILFSQPYVPAWRTDYSV